MSPGVLMEEPARKRSHRKYPLSSIDSMDLLGDDEEEDVGASAMKNSRLSMDSLSVSNSERQNHSEIEKRRRDKMNAYISELSMLLPMCNAMNRKLDKLTVLRMAVQHIKSLRGAANTCTETSHRPSFLSDEEMKQLILKAAEGFLFVVSCDRARILYVSESVKNILNFSRNDLIGQSLFDYLHPRDINKTKEQLSSSDSSPRERLIDARTMMPVKTDFQHTIMPTHLSSGARRSFFCQMRCGDKDIGVKPEKNSYQKRKKNDRKSYCLIHCTGYLKSWPMSKMDLGDAEEVDDNCNLSCLVAVGQMNSSFENMQLSKKEINVRPVEYISRLSIDGKFTFLDQGVTLLLGYLPQELLGTSVYEYYHQNDITDMADIHKKVLMSKERVGTPVYRFKSRNGSFVQLRSEMLSFINPWTKEVEYIVCTNKLVNVQEVSSTEQDMNLTSFPALDMDESSESFKTIESEIAENSKSFEKKRKKSSALTNVTRAGYGRIGRQIAEEIMELQRASGNNMPQVDSTNINHASSVSPDQNKHVNMVSNMVPVSMNNSTGTGTVASGHYSSVVPNPVGPTSREMQPYGRCPVPQNGITKSIPSEAMAGPSNVPDKDNILIENVINEANTVGNVSNDEGNDEAAMSLIMSLLGADAGLGGPIDFSDLPWPL